MFTLIDVRVFPMGNILLELLGDRTPLYPRTKKRVGDLYHFLDREKVTAWLMQQKGITDVDGHEIACHLGVTAFEGSSERIFWHFVDPFIKNGIIKILDETAKSTKEAGLDPNPFLEEAADLLELMIRKIYARMADIDRRLRTRGFPGKSPEKDVSVKIAQMKDFLYAHFDSTKLLHPVITFSKGKVGMALESTPAISNSLVISDENLNKIIEEIDEKMRIEGIKIPTRPMKAQIQASKKLNYDFILGDPLSERINSWFVRKYGDRLKQRNAIGTMVIEIRHDPFLMVFPIVYGENQQVNPLEYVEGATAYFLNSLTNDELDEIKQLFGFGYDAYQEMEVLPSEALADIEIAINQIMQPKPEPGLSKWASLQTAEKTLKAFIKKQNASFPFKHNLDELEKQCQALGMPPLPTGLLAKIQCPAGVRYGEVSVTLTEAIVAHQASLKVCKLVAMHYPIGSTATSLP